MPIFFARLGERCFPPDVGAPLRQIALDFGCQVCMAGAVYLHLLRPRVIGLAGADQRGVAIRACRVRAATDRADPAPQLVLWLAFWAPSIGTGLNAWRVEKYAFVIIDIYLDLEFDERRSQRVAPQSRNLDPTDAFVTRQLDDVHEITRLGMKPECDGQMRIFVQQIASLPVSDGHDDNINRLSVENLLSNVVRYGFNPERFHEHHELLVDQFA